MSFRTKSEVQTHLCIRGFDESFILEGKGEYDLSEDNTAAYDNDDATGDSGSVKEMVSALIRGVIHGDITSNSNEEPNAEGKKFFGLLTEAKKELYPGCKEVTKVSFIVRLFQIRCMFGLSSSALASVLQLFYLVLPEGHCVPDTLEKVKKVVHDLGLDYQKIHACVNDCVLFRKEYAAMDTCPTCGESRWQSTDSGHQEVASNKRVPQKILRYLPITP